MRSRKEFLQTSFLGLIATSIAPTASTQTKDIIGIVKQSSDSETYYVRENVPITIYLSKAKDKIETVSICGEELPPGSNIAIHKHLYSGELFYFQKGNGIFIMDDKEIEVNEGSTAFVPRNTWHGFKNTGSTSVEFIFGYTPSGFEDFFRQIR